MKIMIAISKEEKIMKNTVLISRIKRQKFHKDTFDNISEERKKRILDVSIKEFAEKGYNAANINAIAQKAEISIGSLYSYFASKEDLFLTIVDVGFQLIEEVINNINIVEEDIFSKLEKLFRTTREYAIKYPEMNQIYLDLTTQGLSGLANRLSTKLESITVEFYNNIINEAKIKGIIRTDINLELTSFLIDNMLTMYQFSFSSDYYRDRMKIFLGSKYDIEEDALLNEIMKFIKRALG